MSDVKKLGKGLEDISYLFLSSPENNPSEPKSDVPPENPVRPVNFTQKRICLLGDDNRQRNAFLTIHLAMALAKLGTKIAVVDCDDSLPCLNFFLSKKIFTGTLSAESLICEGPMGIHLLGFPASVVSRRQSPQEKESFLRRLETVERSVDVMLLCVSQKSPASTRKVFTRTMNEFLIPVQPINTSLLESYQTIKGIFAENPSAKIGVIVSDIDHMYEIEPAYKQMAQAVSKFLDKELYKYGFMFRLQSNADDAARLTSFYDADVMACISNIAQIVILRANMMSPVHGTVSLFRRLSAAMTEGVVMV